MSPLREMCYRTQCIINIEKLKTNYSDDFLYPINYPVQNKVIGKYEKNTKYIFFKNKQ